MGLRRKIPVFGKWLAVAGCIFLLSVFLCDVVTGGVARADMGPKPSITVKVVCSHPLSLNDGVTIIVLRATSIF